MPSREKELRRKAGEFAQRAATARNSEERVQL
jgi:hypothetical protein